MALSKTDIDSLAAAFIAADKSKITAWKQAVATFDVIDDVELMNSEAARLVESSRVQLRKSDPTISNDRLKAGTRTCRNVCRIILQARKLGLTLASSYRESARLVKTGLDAAAKAASETAQDALAAVESDRVASLSDSDQEAEKAAAEKKAAEQQAAALTKAIAALVEKFGLDLVQAEIRSISSE